MSDFIEDLPYSIVSISLNKDIVDTQPFIWNKFKVMPTYTYVLDLKSLGTSEVWSKMDNRLSKDANLFLTDENFQKLPQNYV